ncbi:hypothetical protein [Luteimonas sp. 3794]|uniref:hypothetical protein n=1 Tax=Luteimonas sp. 3794 TaxID=2817730 RepID=UPI00286B6E84|nr:hypothetical protein [Luteimonas sp. 3794]
MQRGNNRLPCFLDDGDRLRYLQALQEALMATGVQLHAYVLMDNHVHLLGRDALPGVPGAGGEARIIRSSDPTQPASRTVSVPGAERPRPAYMPANSTATCCWRK